MQDPRDSASFRFVRSDEAPFEGMSVWPPVHVLRSQIEAEIERLADEEPGADGRRASLIVHPLATPPGLGLSPGVDVTINVLKPGEETTPLRRNSNQFEFCLSGHGWVKAGNQEIETTRWSGWNVPSMKVYQHRNLGKDLFVRLSYSNAPVLEKLNIHYVEPGDAIVKIDPKAADQKLDMAIRRENAPDFVVTDEGARLRGYEFLTDIEVVENKMIHWPWEKVEPHLPKIPGDNKRNILLLYNPATERRNGTTHSFFATLAVTAPGTPPRKVGRGHKHSSVAINYHFKGHGRSIVDGREFVWEAGDLMLSAPSWSEHAHYPSDDGHGILTIQDHPQQIGMESLIWQERMDGPIRTLGSEEGERGFVGPRQAG